MSLVDVRFPELDLFLQRWRARLNRRWLAGEALSAWAVAGAVLLPLAWFVPGGTVWWAVAGAVAAVFFAVWQVPRRLNRYRAAAWLDERCQTKGLFGAAATCLQRGAAGDAETRVLQSADAARPQTQVRLPWRRFALRSSFAALVAAAGLLSFEAPSLIPFLGTAQPDRQAEAPAPSSQPQAASPREMNPGDVARKLFPENPRLAALAEQALTEGGEDALRAMLQQAQDSQSLPGTGKSRSQPRPGPRSDRPGDGQQSQRPDKPGDQAPQAGGRSTPPPGGNPAPGGDLGGQGRDKGRGSTQGPADSGSGDDPGKGHSEKRLGQIDPGPRRGPLVLKEPPAAGLFEFALPGSGPKLPSADALSAARRTAESQVARVDPPLEFQSTIRDYFLSLTQEVSP